MFVHFQEQVTQHPTVLRYIHPPTTTDSTGQQTKWAQLRIPSPAHTSLGLGHGHCVPGQGQSWAWNTGKKQAGRGCSKLFCQLQELCLGRIICNWVTLYSKEGSFVFLPYLRFKIFPLGNVARGGLGLFLSQGVPVPGEVWKGGLNSLECLYYTHSAERNMLPPGTRSTRDPTGSHAKD